MGLEPVTPDLLRECQLHFEEPAGDFRVSDRPQRECLALPGAVPSGIGGSSAAIRNPIPQVEIVQRRRPPAELNSGTKRLEEFFMSSIPNSVTSQVLTVAPAANADRLSELPRAADAYLTETASGWDAYDVWRRFIKDARDRRQSAQPSLDP